jgi:hypothetical protein
LQISQFMVPSSLRCRGCALLLVFDPVLLDNR